MRRRGRAISESGAFLLGRIDASGVRYVEAFLPYDDIDPRALRGAIVFDGSRMDEVWRLCKARGLQVVADIHTHPGDWYGQSRIDQANPMMPEQGHLALILPNFADRVYAPGEFGIYEYRGRDGWIDHSATGRRFMHIGGS